MLHCNATCHAFQKFLDLGAARFAKIELSRRRDLGAYSVLKTVAEASEGRFIACYIKPLMLVACDFVDTLPVRLR